MNRNEAILFKHKIQIWPYERFSENLSQHPLFLSLYIPQPSPSLSYPCLCLQHYMFSVLFLSSLFPLTLCIHCLSLSLRLLTCLSCQCFNIISKKKLHTLPLFQLCVWVCIILDLTYRNVTHTVHKQYICIYYYYHTYRKRMKMCMMWCDHQNQEEREEKKIINTKKNNRRHQRVGDAHDWFMLLWCQKCLILLLKGYSVDDDLISWFWSHVCIRNTGSYISQNAINCIIP